MKNQKKTICVGTLLDNPDVEEFIEHQENNLKSLDAMCQRQDIDTCTRDIIFNIIWVLSQPDFAMMIENRFWNSGSVNQIFLNEDGGYVFEIKKITKDIADALKQLADADIIKPIR